MRVLIAHDGSAPAAEALALAAALPWPPITELRLVRVLSANHDAEAAAALAELERAGDRLRGDDRTVSAQVEHGRAATVLARVAAAWRSDLLMVGSRGFSPLRSLLLGSTSAELVAHAPCSVLVSRGSGTSRVVIGTDGSQPATAMARVLCGWELLSGMEALVLGVAPPEAAGDGGEVRRDFALATRRLAARLQTCGVTANDEVRFGDPASVLIEVARAGEADIVCLAAQGRTGMRGLHLGGTARTVVQHAGCSVLVVRGDRG
jgi:nucleotide-binding universal stress UspA family protein